MTNLFVVRVTANIPYPVTFEYTEKATGFATAVRRAIAKYKKEPRTARKHIDALTIKVGRGIISL